MLAWLLVGVFSAGCGSDEGGGQGGPGATAVEATTAWRDTVSVRATSVGSLQADAVVELRPEIDGIVAEIRAEEGERVESGQVLVRLDARELRARYEAAVATLRRAEAEAENFRIRLERNEGLLATGAISPQTYDDLKTSHELAVARVEEARASRRVAARELEKTVIRAPFAGRIDSRSFYLGDLVTSATVLFRLVDNDTLKVEFSMPERYAPKLEPGSPTRIRVASLPNQSFAGVLTFISPLVERETRTLTVKAAIPNPEGALRAGQFADVEVEIERRPDAVIVPETAIVPRSGQNFVFLVREGAAAQQAVETGVRQPGLVEVLSGVQAGDTVVVAGQQRLRDGMPVQVRLQDPDVFRGPIPREAGS